MVVISPTTRARSSAIEKAIRDRDLGVNPTNDGTIIRVVVPAAHRGAPPGARQGGASTRRRSRVGDPQHPAPRQGDAGQAGEGRRRGRGRRRAAPRRSSRRLTHKYVGRSTTWSSTRKPSCSRSERPRQRRSHRGRRPSRRSRCRAAPAPEDSRAGRNLPAAIAVGAALGAHRAIAHPAVPPKLWSPLLAARHRDRASTSWSPALADGYACRIIPLRSAAPAMLLAACAGRRGHARRPTRLRSSSRMVWRRSTRAARPAGRLPRDLAARVLLATCCRCAGFAAC